MSRPGLFRSRMVEVQPAPSLASTGYRDFGAICLFLVRKNWPFSSKRRSSESSPVARNRVKSGWCSLWPGILGLRSHRGVTEARRLPLCGQRRPRVWGNNLAGHSAVWGIQAVRGPVPSPCFSQAALLHLIYTLECVRVCSGKSTLLTVFGRCWPSADLWGLGVYRPGPNSLSAAASSVATAVPPPVGGLQSSPLCNGGIKLDKP